MTKEQARTNFRYRLAAWESRHNRNGRSRKQHTHTGIPTDALLNDPTWKDTECER